MASALKVWQPPDLSNVSKHMVDAVWQAPLVLEIRVTGYEPLIKSGAYPETKQFLRVWHPAFQDAFSFSYKDLRPAMGKGNSAVLICPFKEWRAGIEPSGANVPVSLDDRAILGLELYASTVNKDGQYCIKVNGTTTRFPLKSLQDMRFGHETKRLTQTRVEFICSHLEAELGAHNAQQSHLSSKAYFEEISVRVLRKSHVYTFKPASGYALAQASLEEQIVAIRSFIEQEYQNFFRMREPIVPKMKDYYSLQYVIAPGVLVPSSGYMLRMTDPEIPKIQREHAVRMFQAAMHGRPEVESADAWVAITDTFLDSKGDNPPQEHSIWRRYRSSVQDLKEAFMDCLKVAMDMLTMYSTSVPYLVDMEARGVRGPGHRSRESKNVQEVERFWPATQSYGHDCEDSAMHEDFVKRAIQGAGLTLGDRVLHNLARLYALFRSCVTQMFCSGDPGNTTVDDGIFHYATYLIPRYYMAECEARGRAAMGKTAYPPLPQDVRTWERDYKTWLGVFLLEGTNTTDPAQFKYSSQEEEVRKSVATEAYVVRKHASKQFNSTVNVLHSEVYRSSAEVMSGFYKFAISCFRGDDPFHRESRTFDYVFTDLTRGGARSWGLRVESLSQMEDSVAVAPIMTYDWQIYETTKRLLNIYCQKYTPLTVNPAVKMSKRISIIESDRELTKYLDTQTQLSEEVNRRLYVRLHPLEVDLDTPDRAKKFVETLRAIITNPELRIVKFSYYCDYIADVPMDPITMTGPGQLTRVVVLLFFRDDGNIYKSNATHAFSAQGTRGQFV
jgi:hypothetical protein